MNMYINSAELAKRIYNCLSDNYNDERCRDKDETELYNELSQINNGNPIKVAFIKLCEKIEERENNTLDS